jgi:hypothetical protein
MAEIGGCKDKVEGCEDGVEGCEDGVEGCEDEVEGCEVPANDEGVHDIAKGSRLHKKFRAKVSMARYFWTSDAGPLKITG